MWYLLVSPDRHFRTIGFRTVLGPWSGTMELSPHHLFHPLYLRWCITIPHFRTDNLPTDVIYPKQSPRFQQKTRRKNIWLQKKEALYVRHAFFESSTWNLPSVIRSKWQEGKTSRTWINRWGCTYAPCKEFLYLCHFLAWVQRKRCVRLFNYVHLLCCVLDEYYWYLVIRYLE
jgi:hypothetical protein